LMHTHFHLLVSVNDSQKFSHGLKWLKWSYARYFNFREQRFGPLWRDRFKSLVIEDERYLNACGRYIENNPVEAGLVKRCENWPHSSSQHYFLGKKDPLIDDYAFDGTEIDIPAAAREEFFTKGHAIGSQLFKIHISESLSVPI
jgi:putative transposase